MENLTTTAAPAWHPASGLETSRPSAAQESTGGFAALMDGLQHASPAPQSASVQPATYTVASGDTLTGIVQQLANHRQTILSGEQRMRLALDLAAHNQISNPNRIRPGQSLQTGELQAALAQLGSDDTGTVSPVRAQAQVQPQPSTQDWLSRRRMPSPPTAASQALLSPQTQRAIPSYQAANPSGPHAVLSQTLDRAVQRGFIPPQEKQAVQSKILQLAQKYRFNPDDFARMTLMESDGMNPRASNQRCHGIIQFCDGPNRGAATVGMAQQPKAILGMSVYQQLSLVDTYFQEAGLGKQGPASLDDLYLTVLQPAARQEKQVHAPLNIPPQARYLHPDADTSQAITRQSIVQGLLKNTRDKLGQLFSHTPAPRPVATQVSQAPTDRTQQLR